jgi:RNA polymerase sigma-70 factor (ECF subfamily)
VNGSAYDRVFRDEWRRIVAALVRDVRDLDLAEDAAQEAVVQALRTWPRTGVPDRPGAWLLTAARRKAIDRLRRDAAHADRAARLARLELDMTPPAPQDPSAVSDDQLALIFACCHPALAIEAQVALTLRTLCGLTTAEVARAFLVPEPTMAQRIVRAKRKIRVAGIPLSMPEDHLLVDRTTAVIAVVYLVFNEGYSASAGENVVRGELCDEAIRLARVLTELLPDDAEVLGLLALMLLTDARRGGRLDDHGELVPLEEQDRRRWDHHQVAEGMEVLERAARLDRTGPYQLQAAIAAVHDRASTAATTDWLAIVALYRALVRLQPTPVVRLNLAVAIAMADGPDAGLYEIDRLDGLESYHLLHAARADLLRRAGRTTEAVAAYERALAAASTAPEQRFLRRRISQLAPSPGRTGAADRPPTDR